MKSQDPNTPGIEKCPTGISGLDEIAGGGLPRGRQSLVCGAVGSGKTLLSMEFLYRGITEYDEPGVFVCFEEKRAELLDNFLPLGWDLEEQERKKRLHILEVVIERNDLQESGSYDLEGLLIRLGHAIDQVGAKRIVLDTMEALFGGFSNGAVLRAEIRRLFRWLKERGVTSLVTGERSGVQLTRNGLEEYVSDCVVLLDHRIDHQLSTRRLRIVKYRGTAHGTNEYPFLIEENGITVLPITSVGLDYLASSERISTGIERLDTMLDGEGLFRGTSVLITGTAGTGKTSLAAHFAGASARRDERCIYFAFEESADQIVRNLRSIGLDLQPWVDRDLLRFVAVRPTESGLEQHLASMRHTLEQYRPGLVVVDPISNLAAIGSSPEVKSMLARFVDFMKKEEITSVFTNLTAGGAPSLEETEIGISSLMDAWLVLRDVERDGERNRELYIVKARGIGHSNQVREFLLSEQGIDLADVYLGPEGVLTGSARYAREARVQFEEKRRLQEMESLEREMERRREAMEARIAALRAESEVQEERLRKELAQQLLVEKQREKDRTELARLRKADSEG